MTQSLRAKVLELYGRLKTEVKDGIEFNRECVQDLGSLMKTGWGESKEYWKERLDMLKELNKGMQIKYGIGYSVIGFGLAAVGGGFLVAGLTGCEPNLVFDQSDDRLHYFFLSNNDNTKEFSIFGTDYGITFVGYTSSDELIVNIAVNNNPYTFIKRGEDHYPKAHLVDGEIKPYDIPSSEFDDKSFPVLQLRDVYGWDTPDTTLDDVAEFAIDSFEFELKEKD